MSDVAAEVRAILVYHLGADERCLTDDARLAEDLGADALLCELRERSLLKSRGAGRVVRVGQRPRVALEEPK